MKMNNDANNIKCIAKCTSMKTIARYTSLTLLFVLLSQSSQSLALFAEDSRKSSVKHQTLYEEKLYALDILRAKDLTSAWESLVKHKDRDHYIRAVFKSPRREVQKHELTLLERHGALVNLKFVELDEDDEWKMLSIRASELVQLELIKRPW
ncbi:MAG: hypothetical protein HQL32_00265 [Planctomycetes bacterium]|nr:hypothetical protein [Planctomycetota bacterium]